MIINLYIGTDKLDLFGDEDINLNSSIADVSDITKNTTEYTKSFTVPASDNNNAIFKHYYDANIDDGFDARIKQSGSIELDGIPFKYGKFRLNKVALKNNKPSSYTLNFWGRLVSLKDLLKKDELTDLDFTSYDHAYNSTTVKAGLIDSNVNADYVYTPIVKKRYIYNADVTDNTQEATIANIAWGGGVNTGIVWNDLRPSIKLIRIIEAIEVAYGITFSRDFFGTSDFAPLYLWANNTSEVLFNWQVLDFTTTNDPYMNLTTNKGLYPSAGTYTLTCTIIPEAGYENTEYIFRKYNNGEIQFENNFKGTKFFRDVDPAGGEDNEVYYEVGSSAEFSYTAGYSVDHSFVGTYTSNAAVNTLESNFLFINNLPKIKIIDFLKGLFNMFKLVVVPTSNTNYYINTLDNYYAEGQLFDLTKYVDYSEVEIARGDILNEINFKFQEPTTILNKQFEEDTRVAYGDSEVLIKDDTGNLLDGESLEFELPFEQIIYERLLDLNDNNYIELQYGAAIDETLAAVNPKPHIFYRVINTLATKSIGFITDTGVKQELNSTINTPSHSIVLETDSTSLIFDREFSTWDGRELNQSLYTVYHKTYLDSIYNVKRRNFKYKAIVPLRILTSLSLNDLIQIKENYYRIDNYNLNLLNGHVEFNLINSFDNTIQGFSPTATSITVNYTAQAATTYVLNLNNYTAVKTDTGDGTGWVTITDFVSNLIFTFDESILWYDRTMQVVVTNTDTLQAFTLTLTQTFKRVTADNNNITADNNILTSDTN
jgi:hypothetical protein